MDFITLGIDVFFKISFDYDLAVWKLKKILER